MNRKKIVILVYHGVINDDSSCSYTTQLPFIKFKWQMEYLKKHYNIQPLKKVINKIKANEPLEDFTACITFDDGFQNNYTVAYPYLKKHKIPATIFLSTGNIDTTDLLWTDDLFFAFNETAMEQLDLGAAGMEKYFFQTSKEKEKVFHTVLHHLKRVPVSDKIAILLDIKEKLGKRKNVADRREFYLLTWEQISEMKKGGPIDFGGHTVNHEILSRMDGAMMEKELIDCCQMVSEKTGEKYIAFAYPEGGRDDITQRAIQLLKDSNILCGLTTIEGLNEHQDDFYQLKRISVGSEDSNYYYKLLCSGLIYWLKGNSKRIGVS